MLIPLRHGQWLNRVLCNVLSCRIDREGGEYGNKAVRGKGCVMKADGSKG